MTAPERIWAWEPKTGLGMWVNNPALNGFHGDEYILHTRAALAASPLVQEIVAEAVKAERAALSSSPVAVSIAPETDAKPQGRWCWACLRHEVQADGWCRKCGGMTGQPQEKGE